MNIPKNDESVESDMNIRVQLLEERVSYLESLILKMSHQNQIHDSEYDIDEIRNNITITTTHLSQILETNMEDQIISIIIEENKKKPFMKMTKHLFMYKTQIGWVYMDDSDLKLLIETIEHKILLFHSKSGQDAETHFDNNKIIYGLNLSLRFKKIKIKLIDNI
jgi:hypothetical protein